MAVEQQQPPAASPAVNVRDLKIVLLRGGEDIVDGIGLEVSAG